jgi:hypothetical protein
VAPRSKPLDQERELVEFLERLPFAKVGVSNYRKVDQARDFIATFRESESGRRVFTQICALCDPHIGPNDADKPGKLAFAAGQRYVLAKIMQAFIVPDGDLTDVPAQSDEPLG